MDLAYEVRDEELGTMTFGKGKYIMNLLERLCKVGMKILGHLEEIKVMQRYCWTNWKPTVDWSIVVPCEHFSEWVF